MAWGDARERRQERKESTKLARIESRTAKQAARQATTAEMAKQGMRRGQVLADVAGQAIGAARDIMAPAGADGKSKSNDDTKSGDGSMMPLLIGAGALYFLMKRKK